MDYYARDRLDIAILPLRGFHGSRVRPEVSNTRPHVVKAKLLDVSMTIFRCTPSGWQGQSSEAFAGVWELWCWCCSLMWYDYAYDYALFSGVMRKVMLYSRRSRFSVCFLTVSTLGSHEQVYW